MSLPMTTSPVAFAGIFSSILVASWRPRSVFELPTNVSTLEPGSGAASIAMTGMP